MNPRREHVDTFSLSQWFGRPAILEADNNNMEELTLGMTLQNLEETDSTFVEDVSKNDNFLINSMWKNIMVIWSLKYIDF